MEKQFSGDTCSSRSIGKPQTNQLRQFIIAIGILLFVFGCILAQLITNQDGFQEHGATKEEEGFHEARVMCLYMMEGFLLGYVLSRAFFGFTGAFTKPLKFRDFSTSKAVLILLLVSTFAITFTQIGLNSAGADNGTIYENSLTRGNAISFSLILGGLLFGVGMTYASGCASGVLQDGGEGNARAFIVIIGFMIGGFIGIIFKPIMTSQENWMGKGPYFAFWDKLGLIGGLIFNLFLITMIYFFILYLEKRWGNKERIKSEKEFVQNQNDMYDELRPRFIKNEKLSRTYYSLFIRNYTLTTGALVIAVIGVSIYTATGSFGISTTYAMWPTYLWVQMFGDVSNNADGLMNAGFIGGNGLGLKDNQILMVNAGRYGFWHDGESWQDIMIIAGALFSVLMAGKFKFKTNNLNTRRFFIFLSGGILMGFATRIGGGCNIGALYDPIITTSISGYIFGLGMMGGAFIAYQSFKIIDPPSLTE